MLCGRATWKDGIAIYGKQGGEAFREWLETEGVKNIQNVNDHLKPAHPWYEFYGAKSADAAGALELSKPLTCLSANHAIVIRAEFAFRMRRLALRAVRLSDRGHASRAIQGFGISDSRLVTGVAISDSVLACTRLSIGPAMHVVASAITTIIVYSAGDRMPSS